MSALSAQDVTVTALRQKYEQAGQGQVYAFWDELSPEEQSSLHHQLASIDPARVNQIFQTATAADASTESSGALSPPPPSSQDSVIGHAERAAEWNALGLGAIKAGEVGVLLMAGGQGTRLGSSAPKGCYDIGLPSHKSLFQLQAERIKGLGRVAGGAGMPWYIMTSGPTRKPTEDFFRENNYFGLEKENVIFFEQGKWPRPPNSVLGLRGMLWLAERWRPLRCPSQVRARLLTSSPPSLHTHPSTWSPSGRQACSPA